jgi:hypothetical protein
LGGKKTGNRWGGMEIREGTERDRKQKETGRERGGTRVWEVRKERAISFLEQKS